MGMIDYSGWFQPIPESPTARGLGALTKSIQAITERRRLQQQHEAEQKGLAERAQMEDARQRQLSADRIAQDQADLAQRKAQAEAQAAQQKAQLEHQRQQAEAKYWQDSEEAYKSGAPEVGDRILEAGGVTRQMNNIEDISMEEMLNYPVAPRGPRPPPGAIEPGNVDLYAQPEVKNPDGTTSTVHSFSVGMDGKEVLLPTVTPDGRHLSQQDALGEYDRTGRHLGMFGTPDEATAYAEQLHNDYASGMYKRRPPPSAEAQAEDAQTQALYDRFNQQGLIRPDGTATPFNGPRTLARRAALMEQENAGLAGADPLTDRALKVMPKMVSSGAIKPDDASKIYTDAEAEIQRNKRAELAAREAAQRQRFEKPMSENQTDSAARNAMVAYLGQIGFKATRHDVDEARRLKDVSKGIREGNWGLTGVLSGMFSKLSQGGTGVLTDSDMRTFWSGLGSLKDKTLDGWNKWVSGTPTPEKLTEIDKALDTLEKTGRRKIAEAYAGSSDLVAKYGEDGDRWLRALFGRGLPAFEKMRKEAALKAAAGGKK